jgi:hypothetical protein
MPDSPVPDDLPPIEIDVNGAWRPGRLRSWEPRPDGLWADVIYQTDPGQYLDRTLPAEQIRPVGS